MLIMNGVPARGVNRYDITIRLPGPPNAGRAPACSQKVLKIRHRRKHLRISAFVEETGESPFASLVMPTQADIPKLMSGWAWAHSGRHELLFVLLSLRPWKRERIYHTNPAVFLMQGYILNAFSAGPAAPAHPALFMSRIGKSMPFANSWRFPQAA